MSQRERDEYRLQRLGIIGQPHEPDPGARAIENASLKLLLTNKRQARPHDRTAADATRARRPDAAPHRAALDGRAPAGADRDGAGHRPEAGARRRAHRHLDTQRTREVLALLRELCSERGAAIAARHARPAGRRLRRPGPRAARRAPAGRTSPTMCSVRSLLRCGTSCPTDRGARMSLVRHPLSLPRAAACKSGAGTGVSSRSSGIAVGVALLFASQVASTSLTPLGRAAQQPARRQRAAAARRQGPRRLQRTAAGGSRGACPACRIALPVLEQQAERDRARRAAAFG